jgi:hypothetical protein
VISGPDVLIFKLSHRENQIRPLGVKTGYYPPDRYQNFRGMRQAASSARLIGIVPFRPDGSTIGCSDYCHRNFPFAVRSRATI